MQYKNLKSIYNNEAKRIIQTHKTMIKMKIITIIVLWIALFHNANGQSRQAEYKIKISSGKLIVDHVNNVTFEGYNGNEIIISSLIKSNRNSSRAEGLRVINGLGLEDNTDGLGLSVEKNSGNITLQQVSRRASNKYIIKVPKGVAISYEHATHEGNSVTFRNIESEIEISTRHNDVKLENVTGPMTINTVHGKIEGSFANLNQKNPVAIASVHGLIDIALPKNTKANLRLKTSWGEILTNMDIAIERESSNTSSIKNKYKDKKKSKSKSMWDDDDKDDDDEIIVATDNNKRIRSYSYSVNGVIINGSIDNWRFGGNNSRNSSQVIGKLNGGGVSFSVTSNHGNIYLREKK